MVLDELRVANWQRTGKRRNRPKPISPLARRPGVRYGRTDRSPQEVAQLLARYGPQPNGDGQLGTKEVTRA